MAAKGMLAKIVNLALKPEHREVEWSQDLALRRCVYLLLGIILLGFIWFIVSSIFSNKLEVSEFLTRIYRATGLLISFSMVIWIILTTILFGRFIVRNNIIFSINFIIFIYLFSVVAFGFSYMYLYMLYPPAFSIEPAITIISSTIQPISIRMKIEFILYSAFQSMSCIYYKIHGNSIRVSVMNYIQSFYTIGIIALWIAGSVNQRTRRADV